MSTVVLDELTQRVIVDEVIDGEVETGQGVVIVCLDVPNDVGALVGEAVLGHHRIGHHLVRHDVAAEGRRRDGLRLGAADARDDVGAAGLKPSPYRVEDGCGASGCHRLSPRLDDGLLDPSGLACLGVELPDRHEPRSVKHSQRLVTGE